MAANPSYFNPKTNSENIYAFLIGLLGLILGYIFYSNQLFSISIEEPAPAAVRPSDTGNVAKLEAIKLDFSIFENIIFQELKVFGEIPVVSGVTGKNDPFRP